MSLRPSQVLVEIKIRSQVAEKVYSRSERLLLTFRICVSAALAGGVLMWNSVFALPVSAQSRASGWTQAGSDAVPSFAGQERLRSVLRSAHRRKLWAYKDLRFVRSLSLTRLKPTDTLLIVGASSSLSGDELRMFVRDGGSVFLAGEQDIDRILFRKLGFSLQVPTHRFSSGGQDLVAAPIQRLTESDAGEASREAVLHTLPPFVILNRAGSVSAEGAASLYAVKGKPTVSATRLEQGRVVVVADTSIFIDRMLSLAENRSFVVEVLAWLSRRGSVSQNAFDRSRPAQKGTEAAGILYVASASTEFSGTYEHSLKGPAGARRIRRFLASLAAFRPTPVIASVVTVLLFVAACLGLLFRVARPSAFRIAPTRKFSRPRTLVTRWWWGRRKSNWI